MTELARNAHPKLAFFPSIRIIQRLGRTMPTRGTITGVTVALLLAACADGSTGELSPHLPPAVTSDLVRANELLQPNARLPTRAEVVALTDRVSITADKRAESGTGEAPTPAELRLKAAELRERVWRLDGSPSDAREAMALYEQVVADGGTMGCEADWRRARIHAELSGDAAAAYRELFLATERQGATTSGDEDADACLAGLRDMAQRVAAFRPTGTAWQALQREGARLASAQPTPKAKDAHAPPKKGFTGEQIVVTPDAAMIGKEPATVTKIHPYSWKQGGRVVLELTAPATYTTGILKPDPKTGKGHRIYLDVANVKVKGKKHRTLTTEGLVERVRTAKRNNGVRVVLDLSEAVQRRVFYLPNPFRVVIDVGAKTAAAAAPKVAPTPKGKRLVRRVTLDPGHGGWDAGAVGPTGLMERDVALDIAHRAAPALASELGVETMLTRDTDAFIDLEERTARANAFQSDIFISIHCNATENGEAHGHEIFILDPSKKGDQRAYTALARENRSRRGVVIDPRTMDAQVAAIASGLGLGALPQRSRTFAGLLQTTMSSSLATRYPGTHDHGVKTAGFYVLVGAQMPAVLFETAFISNTTDEARLSTADFRQKLADAIVNAVRAYQDGL